MKDERKTKQQLIEEITQCRDRISSLESSEKKMKEVEQALRNSEEKYHAIFNSFYDVYYRTNKEGKIVLISPSCKTQAGYDPEEVVGNPVTMYWLRPEDQRTVLRELIRSGIVNDYELSLRRKDGSIIDASLSSKFVLDSDGKRIGVEGVLRNITERKRAEEELKRSEEKYRELVESINELIYSIDASYKIIYVSPIVEDLLGYRSEELLGKSFDFMVYPDDLIRMKTNLKRVLAGNLESNEYRIVTKSGSVKWFRTSSKPVFDGDRICGVHGLLIDITQQRQAQAALKESEETYKKFIETSPDSVIVVDPFGKIITVSSRTLQMFGFKSMEDLKGLNAFQLIVPSERSKGRKLLAEIIQKGSVYGIEIQLQRQDGSCFPGEFSASVVRDLDDRPKSIITITRDISQRKEVESVVKRERDFTNAILDSANALIVVYDRSGRIVRFNMACTNTTGYTFDEVKNRFPWDFLLLKEDRKRVQKLFKSMKAGLLTRETEYSWLSKEGDNHIIGWSNAVLIEDDGSIEYIISIGVDITQKKLAEAALRDSEEKYKDLVEKADIAIIMSNEQGRFTYFNDRFAELFGYKPEEMQGRNPDFIVHPDDRNEILRLHEQRIRGEKVQNRYEFKGLCKDGSVIHLEIDVALLEENGHIVGTRSYLWDISERVKGEQKIKASLKEKEMLLKEIHHRVKNNMQVISSLLSLQTRHIQDSEVLSVFRQSQDRVRSMALVHEKLYGSGDFTHIEFAQYIKDLVQRLRNTYVTEKKVEIDFDLENVPLGIDSAIPCGLIINELVSNAFKHAFLKKEKQKNRISIRLSEKDNIVNLGVMDNGVGLPGTFDSKKSESLGLHLVHLLAEDQLGGSIEIERKKGTAFLIQFQRPNQDEPA